MTKEDSQQITQVASQVVSLKDYFDVQLKGAMDKIESKLESIAENTAIRHEFLSEATKIKSDTLEKRFDNTNEWRTTVMEILTKTATKEEVNSRLDAVVKAIGELKEWKDKQEGKASQTALMWTAIIAIVGLALNLAKLVGL